MRSSTVEINERRDRIFNELLNNNEVLVNQLAQKLEVSKITVRRDLLFFEEKNYIKRFYGGARLINDQDTQSRSQKISRTKHLIAQKAAEYVNSGDTIFINTSSTAILVLKYLENKEVTVITNNARAISIKTGPNVSVILTGGELRNTKDSMVGDFTLQTLQMVTASKAILGCSGLSYEQGVTTSVHSEVSINQLMLSHCNGPRIILADHTKLGHSASFVSGSIHDVDVLITDGQPDEKVIIQLQELTNIKIDSVS